MVQQELTKYIEKAFLRNTLYKIIIIHNIHVPHSTATLEYSLLKWQLEVAIARGSKCSDVESGVIPSGGRLYIIEVISGG